jgi:hypothetical protein
MKTELPVINRCKRPSFEGKRAFIAKRGEFFAPRGASPAISDASPATRGASPATSDASLFPNGASPATGDTSLFKKGAALAERGASLLKKGASPAISDASPTTRGASLAENASPAERGAPFYSAFRLNEAGTYQFFNEN